MSRSINNFKLVHMVHAIFILTNLTTGYLMLRGMKLLNMHFTSGLSIILIPLILGTITLKRRIFFSLIFLRLKDIRRGDTIIIINKVTAMILFFLVILSFSTGLILRIGGGISFFNIHIFSFKAILTMVPIHLISAILKRRK